MRKFAIAAAKTDTEARGKQRGTSIKTARNAAIEKRDFMQNRVASARTILPSPREFQAWWRALLQDNQCG